MALQYPCFGAVGGADLGESAARTDAEETLVIGEARFRDEGEPKGAMIASDGSRAGMGIMSGERPAMSGVHEDGAMRLVVEKLRRHRGMDFSQYRTGTMRRRIQSRLRATGCADYNWN